MNYQYRFGNSFTTATQTLYQDGGLGRYYQGMGAALVQGKYIDRSPIPLVRYELNFCRACFQIRRHSSQRRDSRFAPIEFVLKELPFTNQDYFCFPVVLPPQIIPSMYFAS